MESNLPRRIIVFCLPGIGDAVFFTPALTLLRCAYPHAHITVVAMFRGTSDILGNNPHVDEVRHFDFFNATARQSLHYLWGLRRERYDLSIMSFPSNRLEYNAVNWLVGHRWSAGHRYQHQSWRNLWFLNNIAVREAGNLHNVEENLRLIRAILKKVGSEVPESQLPSDDSLELNVTLQPDDEQYGERFLAERGVGRDTQLFGFHTYSSTFKNMHRKCWDKDRFVALIRRLGQAYPSARYAIFSGPADEAVNQYIMSQVDSRVFLVREANLRRALAILKHCQVFISNDSGLLHLAAACRVQVVGLYGPTDWHRLYPWTKQHAIVHQDLPCMPCFYYSSRPLRCIANINYACMAQITVESVFAAAQDLLARSHEQPLLK